MTENRPEYGLKPCKCGAAPVIDFEYHDCEWFYVKCQKCGLFFSILESDDETAIVSAWNDRPVEDALRAEIDDLRRRNIDLERTIADLLRDLNQKNLDIFGGE